MTDFLRQLLCLAPFVLASCSLFMAGTTEETNALASEDELISSSMEIPVSSSSPVPQSSSVPLSSSSGDVTQIVDSSGSLPLSSDTPVPSSSGTVDPVSSSSSAKTDTASQKILQSRYWHQFCNEDPNVYVNVNVDVDEGDEISVSYEIPMPLGGGSSTHPEMAGFGIAIRVAGDGPDVFSEMKTWTGGACYMVSSDAPVTLKIGMSPEKEAELEYDLPQATLIGPAEVGSMVIRCLSWLDFEQQGFGPEISIEDAFFNEMTELRFEVHPEEDDYKGELRIYQIRAGGSGISADTDGLDISVNDGTEYLEQPNGN